MMGQTMAEQHLPTTTFRLVKTGPDGHTLETERSSPPSGLSGRGRAPVDRSACLTGTRCGHGAMLRLARVPSDGGVLVADHVLASATMFSLDIIGLRAGWRCLVVAANAPVTVRLMEESATADGCVTLLDWPQFMALDRAQPSVVPKGSFHLVLARGAARRGCIRRLAALVSHGGWLVLEEVGTQHLSQLPVQLGHLGFQDIDVEGRPLAQIHSMDTTPVVVGAWGRRPGASPAPPAHYPVRPS
jgi:hypothetical protein